MSNQIISKDHFVACLKVLQDSDDMARRINRIVREYNRDDFISGYSFINTDTETKLIETLEMAMNDINNWISWWCFEADYGRNKSIVDHTVTNGDTKHFEITTAEQLYDFLVKEN